ncbi:MAG: phosphoribosyltransferase family protein, partial [Myxococcales bacterium]
MGRFAAQAPVVVAIPRGGVPVALEVARALSAPLETVVVRKIVAPGHPDAGIGAVAEQGIFSVDTNALRNQHLSRHELELAAQREYAGMMRALPLYRGARGMPRIAGRTVLVVDDYVATGCTARAAAGALRDLHPR